MNRQRAEKILAGFSRQRVLVIGDVMLDEFIRGVVERLNPEAPVPILHAHQESVATGGAGNTAKNAAMLGATTALVSVVGTDDTARRISAAAAAEGYTARLIADAARPSIRKTRYLAGSQQLLRVDHEATHDVSEAVAQELALAIQEHAQDVTGIIVSDYAKGVITASVAKSIMSAARSRQLMIGADIKPSRAAFFKGVSFIAPNLKEANEYLGRDHLEHRQADPGTLAKQLCGKMKTTVFLTLSAQGIYVQPQRGAGTHVPQPHVVEVADTSGPGDTATVVLLLAELSGATPVEAAQLANAAGAVVVSKIGAVGLTREELLDMLTAKAPV